MPTVLEAIATGNPPLKKPQMEAARFMQNIEGLPDPVKNRLPAIYRRSGIDYRYSCVEDYGREPEDFTFYPRNWSLSPAPSTSQRNRKYRDAVVPLAERVAGEVLDKAGTPPDDITHVIVVSCTGFFAPGLDIELVRRLGLPPDTRRTVVGFMGCYAAFNGLRAAHGFCRDMPGARVLVVCAELCTLHFQVDDTLESAVVNGLFADGVAAAVLSERPAEEARGQLTYANNHTMLDDDSMDDMTWDIGDTGFLMGLAPSVPDTVSGLLPNYLHTLLGENGLDEDDVDFWAIHPGGRAIVEKAQAILDLPDAEVHDSLEVLRLYGNMSSPTILFVLKRFMERRQNGADHLRNGVAMAFGPGLTLEGALFQEMS